MTTYALVEMVTGLSALLYTRRVPLTVQYGKDRYNAQLNTENVAVFREVESADSFEPPPRVGGNPPVIAIRSCGCEAVIRAFSTAPGARIEEHRALMNAFVHQLVSAMIQVGGENQTMPVFGTTGFVDDDDQENEYGARYRIEFELPEIIYSETWDTASGVEWNGTGEIVIDGSGVRAC